MYQLVNVSSCQPILRQPDTFFWTRHAINLGLLGREFHQSGHGDVGIALIFKDFLHLGELLLGTRGAGWRWEMLRVHTYIKHNIIKPSHLTFDQLSLRFREEIQRHCQMPAANDIG